MCVLEARKVVTESSLCRRRQRVEELKKVAKALQLPQCKNEPSGSGEELTNEIV